MLKVAYEDVRKAVKLKSLNRGWRTPDPSPTRDADAEKEGPAKRFPVSLSQSLP